jgi:hypothetical protein
MVTCKVLLCFTRICHHLPVTTPFLPAMPLFTATANAAISGFDCSPAFGLSNGNTTLLSLTPRLSTKSTLGKLCDVKAFQVSLIRSSKAEAAMFLEGC